MFWSAVWGVAADGVFDYVTPTLGDVESCCPHLQLITQDIRNQGHLLIQKPLANPVALALIYERVMKIPPTPVQGQIWRSRRWPLCSMQTLLRQPVHTVHRGTYGDQTKQWHFFYIKTIFPRFIVILPSFVFIPMQYYVDSRHCLFASVNLLNAYEL